jgi:GntR family transcriptional regulator
VSVISFRIDGRSVVPPYLQIVQQVRQALRMGVLDLERDGLVEPRAGHGTFVVGRPAGPPPGTHSRLARSLAHWVHDARQAGLDDESIESLLRITLRAAADEETA